MNTKKKKQRLIFFLPVFTYGGASESIIKLSKFLINHNYSVSLISIGKNVHKKYLKNIGCDVIELNTRRALFSILSLRKIIKIDLKKNYSQIIFVSNIHYANIISLISCFKLKGVKTILTERSSLSELSIYEGFFNSLKKKTIFFLARYFYRFSNLVITNSNFEKKFIKENFNIKNVKCIYPASILKVEKKNNKINQNINRIKKIIYVGRLSKEKGVITILKALTIIKDKLNFKLEIYGDGEEKKNILKFINLNNLKKNVLFNGYIRDKRKIFLNANLFINASWFEGLPNALVQSINNNIFPICSKSPGGNLEVIKHGELGLSFKTNNSDDLARKILFFFEKKIKLNQSKRIKHMENFTKKKSNQKYLKILKNLK